MKVNTAAQTTTWTFVDGDWHEGNVPLVGPRSHVMWLGSSVFDGARWFEGVAPDLDRHAERVNNSAVALGLKPTMAAEEIIGLAWEGLKKFDGKTAVYIRPMYWAEHGGYMGVPADPESTRFCLCLYEAPMIAPTGFSITVSPYRRPTIETMPRLRAIVALGRVAHDSVLKVLALRAAAAPFAHGAVHQAAAIRLYDSYHCSRYNTNTRVLTPDMFRRVFATVRADLG